MFVSEHFVGILRDSVCLFGGGSFHPHPPNLLKANCNILRLDNIFCSFNETFREIPFVLSLSHFKICYSIFLRSILEIDCVDMGINTVWLVGIHAASQHAVLIPALVFYRGEGSLWNK